MSAKARTPDFSTGDATTTALRVLVPAGRFSLRSSAASPKVVTIMGDDREAIIAHALQQWPNTSVDGGRGRDDRGVIGFVNDCLDDSRQPRLRAEERAVIVRENALQARYPVPKPRF